MLSYPSWQVADESGPGRAGCVQHRAEAPDQPDHERASAPSQKFDFKRIAASISIVTGVDAAGTAAPQGWRHRAANGGQETLLSFPDVAHRSSQDDHRVSADQDPVVTRLSEALAAAERDPSEFSALYADALRLVAMVRLLSIDGQVEPIQQLRPPGSAGLPKWRLRRVCDYITAHLGEKVTLADMAAAARLSRMHFAALFLKSTGMRPHQYLLQRRIAAAKDLLKETELPIVQVAIQVGFQTQAHFTTVFKKVTGATPAKWRDAVTLHGLGDERGTAPVENSLGS
ncbi:helix-turn-helix domain-containing protein [Bradyrhizobium sp. HKCCYLRH3099]|uniref:helix-turn-helix domain-containing protein n=1 Tax=unclassified Bradyrhizobium TaxID=2631580 RepID=UPI003EC01AFC